MPKEPIGFWDQFIKNLIGFDPEDWLVKLAAAIVALFLYWCVKSAWKWTRRNVFPKLVRMYRSEARLDRALGAVSPTSKGLWLSKTIPIRTPDGYSESHRTSVPIIFVGNLKGGVGKTTTAANLMAHYALKKNKRVLGIDLDFQGSLTKSCLTRTDYDQLLVQQTGGSPSKAAHLIDNRDAEWLQYCADGVAGVPLAKIVPSYYSLSNAENRIMIEWLLGERDDDVRYQLAKALRDNRTQSNFDIIIIDAPPRLTTACIQGLCAATHVLVPTVLDELSGEAVGTFVDQLRIHQELWPQLRLLGIIGTMTSMNPGREGISDEQRLTDFETDAYVAVRDALQLALQTAEAPLRNGNILEPQFFVPDKAQLARAAGFKIAYTTPGAAGEQVREIFDRLGAELDRRL